MTKFLLGRKGNCYWVVGCHRDSWDSKDYGWLCGEEIDIHGVITLIK